ncbi:hypothetical protein GCM10009558_092860 [Virgisporangium aurantiacum]
MATTRYDAAGRPLASFTSVCSPNVLYPEYVIGRTCTAGLPLVSADTVGEIVATVSPSASSS